MSTDHIRSCHINDVLADFDRYLRFDKAVLPSTRSCYLRHAGSFLLAFADGDGQTELSQLTGPEVRHYVTDLAQHYAPDSVKLIATSIRSLLRFAWLHGLCTRDLSPAVGIVVVHRFGRLPRALNADEVSRLLAVPDRAKIAGARDYAVLLLLSRLGLRTGEVAALKLEDFDWRSGLIKASVKGGETLVLPLPADVGSAIVDYLRVRPHAACRNVFVRVRALPLPLTRGAVTAIVARCATVAGLGTVHAHRLRHTAARMVLNHGGNLREVSQLLGHSGEQVTMMYASYDLACLRPLARPWPFQGAHHV